MKTVAILCGGGPAPGMNTVVGSVARVFLRSGYRVLGINEGYKGLLIEENPRIQELDLNTADQIFTKGGCILEMSRFKPKDTDFNTRLFLRENIDLLVTVGGDDTASTANRLSKYLEANSIKIANIHVPKTIDNDLPLPEGVPTFGYTTAKEMGASICKVLKNEAVTTGNWYVAMSMGREAGHLAYELGKGVHADMIVIPEMFNKTQITIEKMVKLSISSIVKKHILNKKIGLKPSGVIVMSEGVFHELEADDMKSYGIEFSLDAHGHPELGEVSKAHILNKLIKERLKKLGISQSIRPIELGYSLRCVDPCAYDLVYCTTLGDGVKELYDAGHTGCMVSLDEHGNVIPIYLKDVEDENGKIRPRLVNIDKEEVQYTLRESMYYLTKEDMADAKSYIPDAEEYIFSKIMNW